jgi:hypothetical protein
MDEREAQHLEVWNAYSALAMPVRVHSGMTSFSSCWAVVDRHQARLLSPSSFVGLVASLFDAFLYFFEQLWFSQLSCCRRF